MAVAYTCILIATLLPYVWAAVAKANGERYDNRDPRGWQTRQQNPRSLRAHAAHLNAFEAFAPFAAGVLMAQFASVTPGRIALLAVAFVALRVLHGLCYLGDRHRLRSLVWLAGLLCVVALMASAIFAVGGARA